MNHRPPLHLFEAFGVEIEYMIVDADSLDVLPITDRLIEAEAGRITSDVEFDDLAWSNELALHVVELKTAGPASSLEPLAAIFQQHVDRVNARLAPLGGRLMPSAMHPWMNPSREMRLWPHDNSEVYGAFDKVFNCRGHGWANLQSVHLNLPFADDQEFGQLHAAVRLLLPLLPALAASSPIVEGRATGMLDTRLDVYRSNSRRIPSIAAAVIPEPVYTLSDYDRVIFRRIYEDISPFDPGGILQHEWLNARGAIARFERNTIEIRVLDVQECPAADMAVVGAVAAVIKALVDERWATLARQQACATEPLHALLLATIRDAEETRIDDAGYLAQFGHFGGPITAGELWRRLSEELALLPAEANRTSPLGVILDHGTLARRLVKTLGDEPSALKLATVYRELCECLAHGRMFLPDG